MHAPGTTTAPMDERLGLSDLMPARFTATGTEFGMGEMRGIQAAIPIETWAQLVVDEIVTRRDYELNGIDPGNRVVSPAHVTNIKAGLKRHAKKLVTGSFTLAIPPDGVSIDRSAAVDE